MELLTALLAEKWLLSAFLFLWGTLERKERFVDKKTFGEERKAMASKLDRQSDVLLVLQERLDK